MGLHTREVVGNDNTYHCAYNLGPCSNSGAVTQLTLHLAWSSRLLSFVAVKNLRNLSRSSVFPLAARTGVEKTGPTWLRR
jgi:hypothetical protein